VLCAQCEQRQEQIFRGFPQYILLGRTNLEHDQFLRHARRFIIHNRRYIASANKLLTGWTTRVRFPTGKCNFFLTTSSRQALKFSQSPIQWKPVCWNLSVKRPGLESLSSLGIINTWSYTSISPYVFMVCSFFLTIRTILPFIVNSLYTMTHGHETAVH
jgi:hypothetical protein